MFDFSNIQKIQSFLMSLINGLIVTEVVGLKSKMYSMKKIDGKEYNTTKGVSITTEFDKFKDVLFHK